MSKKMKLPDINNKKANLRVQYLSLIGYMARIDGKFDDKEKNLLKKMADRFQLSEKNKKLIFTQKKFNEGQINETFQELKKNKLHYSFILDLISMAMADGMILEPERMMLSQVARLIGLKHEEFHNLINFVQATSNLNDDNHNDPMFQYVIEMFFEWARQRDVTLYKQTTFAINDKVDWLLKKDL
ncbi:MAG: TerB family tellurite resistance protein [Proteobacteria bacterium]|nr:TerB family tellurite resistance protein [Pseudomonadota bacterium]